MKKTEAQKIVETNLIKALDRNDAQAVREACIVLQAMKRKADVDAVNKLPDYISDAEILEQDNNKEAIVQTVEEDFVRNIPNVIKNEVSKHAADLIKMLDVDPEQFREESFENELLYIVEKLKDDPEIEKYINNGLVDSFRPGSNVSIGENGQRIDIVRIISNSNLSQNAKTNLKTVYKSLISETDRQNLYLLLFIMAALCIPSLIVLVQE